MVCSQAVRRLDGGEDLESGCASWSTRLSFPAHTDPLLPRWLRKRSLRFCVAIPSIAGRAKLAIVGVLIAGCLCIFLSLRFPCLSAVSVILAGDRDGERERSRFTPLFRRWFADLMSGVTLLLLFPPFHTKMIKARDFAFATFHRFRELHASSRGHYREAVDAFSSRGVVWLATPRT